MAAHVINFQALHVPQPLQQSGAGAGLPLLQCYSGSPEGHLIGHARCTNIQTSWLGTEAALPEIAKRPLPEITKRIIMPRTPAAPSVRKAVLSDAASVLRLADAAPTHLACCCIQAWGKARA